MSDEAITVIVWIFVAVLWRFAWLLIRCVWWTLRGVWFLIVTLPSRLIHRRQSARQYERLIDQLINDKAVRDADASRFERAYHPPVNDFEEWSKEMADDDHR